MGRVVSNGEKKTFGDLFFGSENLPSGGLVLGCAAEDEGFLAGVFGAHDAKGMIGRVAIGAEMTQNNTAEPARNEIGDEIGGLLVGKVAVLG